MQQANPPPKHAAQAIGLASGFAPRLPLAVGFSGGADSTALLLLAHARWPGQVVAVHVNHGLQAAASEFEVHCREFCESRGIALVVARVKATGGVGDSPEDAARRARWGAFLAASGVVGVDGADPDARLPLPRGEGRGEGVLTHQTLNFDKNMPLVSGSIEFVATKSIAVGFTDIALAHHADDQAETVLLALSRGAGLGGLSAMPARRSKDGLVVHRPMLHLRGDEIRAWLSGQGVSWVSDPSNANEQFTRNRIRAQLMPALDAALPAFRQTFARSAAHAAQANGLLAELALIDLAGCGQPPRIKDLQHLSPQRQANALRHWLRTAHATQASTAQLAELQRQIAACVTRGHAIRIKVGSGWVVREGDVLTFL